MPELTTSQMITAGGLRTRVLSHGPEDGVPVVFVHGNLSSATWWEETMRRLPDGYRAIAPDLRSYGAADPDVKVDATRGMRDFSDDLAALCAALEITMAHFVGHSLGGAVLWQLLADHPARVASLTQVCPGSPFGFGGCHPDGRSCFPDGAGSGASAVNPEFARLLAEGARGADSPFHPLSILNTFVWKPPFVPARIDDILSAALSQHTGPADYPGDKTASGNWPGAAPGKFGPINAMAPIYQDAPLGFTAHAHAPILWIRGADDPVVSDNSLFDLGTLGQADAVPGWPGAEVYPPQPMIAQTGAALDAYEAAGGKVTRIVFDDCGHSPFLEKPEAFDAALHAHLSSR